MNKLLYKLLKENILRYSLLLIILLFLIGNAFAQSDQELKNSYIYGKQLIAEGKYNPAKEVFHKLTQALPNNIYEKHAYYFYALASYQTGDKKIARTYLQKLVDGSPSFSQIDEAKYLLSAILAESGEHKQAIEILNTIKQNSFKEDIINQKKYFSNILSLEQLKSLFQATQDEIVGRTLAQKLINQRNSTEERVLLEDLSKKYNLQGISKNKVLEKPILKPAYNIGLFFPFLIKETSPYSSVRRYQFVYDMYEGMKIAKEELEKEGIKIKFYAFDTERNDTTIRQLVQKQMNSEIDLIIGPIYPHNIKSLSALSEAKKINIVNPFGNDATILQSNPYTFTAEATYQTEGVKTAEFAMKNFAGKKAFVYYGRNLEDSLSAYSHKETLEKANYQVLIRSINSKNIYQKFVSDINSISKTDTAHLFISSKEESVALNLLGATQSARKIFPIIAPDTWLSFEQIPYEKFQFSGVYFFATNFIRTNSHSKNFKKEYITRTNMIPSKFAYLGYEMMYYFGKILAKHGVNFQDVIKLQSYDRGKMMIGFDFTNSNDNQSIAISKFTDGVLEIVNIPIISIESLQDEDTD
jgi:ABC-type branched-subunit amino acid transport system substrate-binding protein/predicted negative regulator of RcsB-dependent stress response